MQNLNQSILANMPVGIPPLAEQKRIMAKVDEMMTLCDQLEAQQQDRELRRAELARASLIRFAEAPTPENLTSILLPCYYITPSDLRKAILALAVLGKLSRDTEPKDILLGEVIELISGQHLLADEQNNEGKGIPYLTGPSDFGAQHPIPIRWTETPKAVAEPGDILITVKGSGVGKTSKLVEQRMAISRQLMAVRAKGTDSDFAHLILMNAADYFQKSMTGIAIPGIGRNDVLKLEAKIPPLAEQRRIVARVEELMAMIDQLEVQIEKAKKASAALLDAAIHELLNPREKTAIDRTGIGCHVVHLLADRKTFGRTALAKFAYLAEAHVGLQFNGQYMREAAGPLDPWIYRFEEEAARERWFTFENTSIRDGNRKIVYRKGDALEAKASEAVAALPKAQRDELDRVLTLLGGKPTEEVEIIATLFAVWNDFLIDGHSTNDDEIVTGFREHWHEKKQKFTAKSLHVWLDWMRRNGLEPTGRGPRTQQHSKLGLH